MAFPIFVKGARLGIPVSTLRITATRLTTHAVAAQATPNTVHIDASCTPRSKCFQKGKEGILSLFTGEVMMQSGDSNRPSGYTIIIVSLRFVQIGFR